MAVLLDKFNRTTHNAAMGNGDRVLSIPQAIAQRCQNGVLDFAALRSFCPEHP